MYLPATPTKVTNSMYFMILTQPQAQTGGLEA